MPTYLPVPPDDADELTWLLYRQHQVISRPQALRFLSAKAVYARLGSGRWQPAARGVYLTHNGPVIREQRRWIAVLAAGAAGPDFRTGEIAVADGLAMTVDRYQLELTGNPIVDVGPRVTLPGLGVAETAALISSMLDGGPVSAAFYRPEGVPADSLLSRLPSGTAQGGAWVGATRIGNCGSARCRRAGRPRRR